MEIDDVFEVVNETWNLTESESENENENGSETANMIVGGAVVKLRLVVSSLLTR